MSEEHRPGPLVTDLVENVLDEELPPYVVPLSEDGTEALVFAPVRYSGWASYHSPALGKTLVWLRFSRDGAPGLRDHKPIVIRELQVVSDYEKSGDLDGRLLRELPLGRMSAAVTQQSREDPNIDQLVSFSLLVHTSPPGGEAWRVRPNPKRQRRPNLRIKVPEGRARRPDNFYALVADRYLWLKAHGYAPAPELAKANGVPLTTVHRWVKEARSRGQLPPPARGGQR